MPTPRTPGLGRKRSPRTFLLACAGVISGIAVFLTLFLWVLPTWLTMYPHVTGVNRLDAMNGARLGIGAVLAVLGTVGGLFYTIRTFRLTQRGQIADRYSKAVEQLANPSGDIRIGGIYALEQTARESPAYQRTVIDVIEAYIRSHASLDITVNGQRARHQSSTSPPMIDLDIRVALTVLRRLVRVTGRTALDLSNSDLPGADLIDMSFVDAHLEDVNFRRAKLTNANLRGADLRGADLSDADLYNADFTDVRLGHSQRSIPGLKYVIGRDSVQWDRSR
jgi:hypothetical protein